MLKHKDLLSHHKCINQQVRDSLDSTKSFLRTAVLVKSRPENGLQELKILTLKAASKTMKELVQTIQERAARWILLSRL